MIQVADLYYTFLGNRSTVQALRGIDLNISEGEFVAVIGPNSSGKTTLARHLTGLLVPSHGRIMVDGLDTAEPDNLLPVRKLVGMVLSNPDNQIVGTIVESDVAFGLENLCVLRDVMGDRVDECLDVVGLASDRKRNPRHLSNGQKQLLALAGILAMRPKYLVFDEATSMLDPMAQKAVLGLAAALKRKHAMTVIWVTHRLDEALCANRVIVLHEGRVFSQGTPCQVFRNGEQIAALGLCVPDLFSLTIELCDLGLIDYPTDFSVEAIVGQLCA
jgi:energy-coupling factor transport system ATP-binding protein